MLSVFPITIEALMRTPPFVVQELSLVAAAEARDALRTLSDCGSRIEPTDLEIYCRDTSRLVAVRLGAGFEPCAHLLVELAERVHEPGYYGRVSVLHLRRHWETCVFESLDDVAVYVHPRVPKTPESHGEGEPDNPLCHLDSFLGRDDGVDSDHDVAIGQPRILTELGEFRQTDGSNWVPPYPVVVA